MKIIKSDTIGEAWLKSCQEIMEKGDIVKDGEKDTKEILNLLVNVKKPAQNDDILKKYAEKSAIDWMLSNFLEQKNVPELKNAPSYGVRLFNMKGKNQIDWVIKKLRSKKETKAATISMIMPEDEAYIPCVSVIDFKIRKNKLNITGMCRAIDFGKKVYGNFLALHKIQEIVAKELDIKTGELTMFNVSAHIYDEDFDKINKILENENH